jgi:Fe-S oxidoreductase
VILYPDIYTNYVHVERGKAAVRALEALGVQVDVPDVPGSGRAPLSQGMVQAAERKMTALWEALKTPLQAGRTVVVIEPTDLAMFHRRAGKLLPEDAARCLREGTVELMDFLRRRLDDSDGGGALRTVRQEPVLYHSHCQQRTLGLEAPTVSFLESLGYDVETTAVECCGMAGSFGYKTEYYELSMRVGEELCGQLEADKRDRTVVASGTSCQEQLQALGEETVRHPVELIAPPA